MKTTLFLLCVFVISSVEAQNVGINELLPNHKLVVKASSVTDSPLLVKSSINEELFSVKASGSRHSVNMGGYGGGTPGILNIYNSQWPGLNPAYLRLASVFDYPFGSTVGMEFSNINNPGNYYRIRTESGTTLSQNRFALESMVSNFPKTLFAFNSTGAMGIGSPNEFGKVEVTHNSTISDPHLVLTEADNDYTRMTFRNDQFPSNFWSLAALSTNTPANDRLNFYHHSTFDVMTLKGDGKVGLGGEPTERLNLISGNIKLDNSDKGIMLNGNDRPFITRAFDPFTSGLYNGLGRWGLFMEPNRMTMGMPNFAGKSFDIVTYNANSTYTSLVSFLSNGNVGLGITPSATLDVNGPIKLEGLNLFEFGAGVAGKEVNAGKVGYNAFGQNALVFLGAGPSVPTRAVYFYAEGGTTFNGSTNTTGEINRAPTGGANMVPVAYGSIAADGTVRSSTGNITVFRLGAGAYAVYVAGESYSHSTHICQATALNNGARFIHVGVNGAEVGAFMVYISGTTNVATDTDFSFVLYKP